MIKLRGFTLLEVLLALSVISIALAALVRVGYTSADTVNKLEEQSIALHVADQVMMQLYQKQGLQTGQHQGSQKWSSNNWFWVADVESTNNPRIARIYVKVYRSRGDEYAQAQLTGFTQI